MIPSPPLESAELARELLQAALDDLHREASQSGREALYEQLLPVLLGRGTPFPAEGGDASLIRALRRLHTRLRERVEARLRGIEPDPVRRSTLRQQLRATLQLPRSR